MYLWLKRSLLHRFNSRLMKHRYFHVKWEVVRILVSCHKVIYNHYLCFNVIWSNVRCTRIPDNLTAPSAWDHTHEWQNNCNSPLMSVKKRQRIALTRAVMHMQACLCLPASPRTFQADSDPIKEYLIKSGCQLSPHEEFCRRFGARRDFSVWIHCFKAGECLQMQKWSGKTSF